MSILGDDNSGTGTELTQFRKVSIPEMGRLSIRYLSPNWWHLMDVPPLWEKSRIYYLRGNRIKILLTE